MLDFVDVTILSFLLSFGLTAWLRTYLSKDAENLRLKRSLEKNIASLKKIKECED